MKPNALETNNKIDVRRHLLQRDQNFSSFFFFFLTVENVWVRCSVTCKQQVLLYACARICACMCALKITVTIVEYNQCYHRTALSVLCASVAPFLSHTFLKRIPTLGRQSHFLLVPYRTLWVTRPERRLCLTWAEIIGDMISGFLCRGREWAISGNARGKMSGRSHPTANSKAGSQPSLSCLP